MDGWARRIAPVVALVISLAPSAEAKKAKDQRRPSPAETTNFMLGLEYSHWLVGPVYLIATEEERVEYLALSSDQEAEAFIETFWKRRDPRPDFFGNDVRQLFEDRAAAADKRFREGATIGRRTDRGAIFVLYGEPKDVEYDISLKPNEPDLEVWIYSKESSEGLDGSRPRRRYWFAEKGGRTVLHIPRASRRNNIIEQPQQEDRE